MVWNIFFTSLALKLSQSKILCFQDNPTDLEDQILEELDAFTMDKEGSDDAKDDS